MGGKNLIDNVKKMPKIEYVFNQGISPYAVEIQSSTIDWAKKINVLNETTTIEKYKKQNIGYLASRAQPYDSFLDVRLASEYLLLFCMLDDYSDLVTNPLDFKDYSDRIISILKGNPTDKDNFLSGWEDWWERVKVGTPIDWQNRITESITKCFEAMTLEIGQQFKNQIPKVHDYINNRQHSGSVLVCFDLIERGGKRYLPIEARSNLFMDLITSAGKITNWTNDILSLEKELRDGEMHNLVISVQKHSQISMQESLDYVKKMLNTEINKYNELKKHLLNLNNPYKEKLKQYIYYLETGVRGNYEWSMRTKRF